MIFQILNWIPPRGSKSPLPWNKPGSLPFHNSPPPTKAGCGRRAAVESGMFTLLINVARPGALFIYKRDALPSHSGLVFLSNSSRWPWWGGDASPSLLSFSRLLSSCLRRWTWSRSLSLSYRWEFQSKREWQFKYVTWYILPRELPLAKIAGKSTLRVWRTSVVDS